MGRVEFGRDLATLDCSLDGLFDDGLVVVGVLRLYLGDNWVAGRGCDHVRIQRSPDAVLQHPSQTEHVVQNVVAEAAGVDCDSLHVLVPDGLEDKLVPALSMTVEGAAGNTRSLLDRIECACM